MCFYFVDYLQSGRDGLKRVSNWGPIPGNHKIYIALERAGLPESMWKAGSLRSWRHYSDLLAGLALACSSYRLSRD